MGQGWLILFGGRRFGYVLSVGNKGRKEVCLDAIGGACSKPDNDDASCVRGFLPVNTFSY